MTDLRESEYDALRATIRERGTMRICAVLGGLVAWGALAITLLIVARPGAITLVPLLVLAATFEIGFFIHTGVERIGRYLQVFYEEAAGSPGWETTVMNYGSTHRGLDPLFAAVFSACVAVNFVASLAAATGRPLWIAILMIAHLVFAYRIVIARRMAAAQRALDLERFRSLASK